MDMDLQYEPIAKENAQEIVGLYESYLNGGQSVREHVLEGMRDKNYAGFRAVCKGETAGFISGRGGVDFTCPNPRLEGEITGMFPQRIYTLDALVVRPGFRRRGIAAELLERMRREMLRMGYRLALTELWMYPDGSIPAEKALFRYGLTLYEKCIPHFYKDLKRYAIRCPVCGEDCRCGAKIKVIDLRGAAGERMSGWGRTEKKEEAG